MQGVASLREARQNVRECMDADPALHSLREMFDKKEGNDAIQGQGIKCVGVLIATPEIVQKCVADKVSEILADVEKVKVVSDPLIHFHLLRFCQNTRLGYLSRHVPSAVIVNACCNVAHVDNAIVKSILQRGTKHKNGNASTSDNWSPPVLE